MVPKLSALSPFLLLLNLLRISSSEHISHNDSLILHQNSPMRTNRFVLVNPEQVPRLEKALRSFFSRIAQPIDKPILLRSKPDANELQRTIRELCNSVRRRLMQFADDYGLINTVRRYEGDSVDGEDPLTEDWYSELLLQSIYLIRDLGNIINEIGSSIDANFGEKNATLQTSKQLTREASGFEFLGVVQDAAEFNERLAQCLLQMADTRKSRFELGRSLLHLTKRRHKEFLQALESVASSVSYARMLKSRSRQKPWHIFLCLSLMTSDPINYDDCIRELQHLETCLHGVKQLSNVEIRDADARSWTKAIERLSDCEIRTDKNGVAAVSCKTARKLPRKMKKKTKYVFERMLDKKISKGSPFHRAVNELGDTLSGCEWGQRFIDELCQYISIYEDGRKKLQRSSKTGANKKAATRHGEVSKALQEYKNGVLLRTFGTISKMHRSAVDYEKFFAEGMKNTLQQAWQGHVNVLTCLMDWMTKLLELHVGESSSGKGPSSSDTSSSSLEWRGDEDSNSEYIEKFAPRPRSKIMKDVDNSMNALMKSMNRLSKHRAVDNNSTLASIANNLLLVTAFVEAIGFVSSLYCFGQPTTNETRSSVELNDEWNRARRSMDFPMDQNPVIDLISHDYVVLKFDENLTLPFWDDDY